MDGIVKIAFAAVMAFTEFSMSGGSEEDRVFVSAMELGTIFIVLLFSGVMDLLTRWGSRTFYQYMDYAGLALFFATVAAILESRAFITAQPLSSVHSLTGYVAFASVVATAAEAVWSDQVLFPVTRSYLLMLQGTWWVQVALLMQEDEVMTGAGGEDPHGTVVFFSIVFSCHAAINFSVAVCVWLLTAKLVERHWCACVQDDHRGQNEDVFLENRVRFNYHVLSRLESESE